MGSLLGKGKMVVGKIHRDVQRPPVSWIHVGNSLPFSPNLTPFALCVQLLFEV